MTRDPKKKDWGLNWTRWCDKHQRPWKLCGCPGEFTVTMPITQEMLDAVSPNPAAYRRASVPSTGETPQ